MIERLLRGLTITSAALLLFRRASAKATAASVDGDGVFPGLPPPPNPLDQLVKQLVPVAPMLFMNWLQNKDNGLKFQARIEAREWRAMAVRCVEFGMKDQAAVAELHARELELQYGFAAAAENDDDEPSASEQH